jgi:hypothetical protein
VGSTREQSSLQQRHSSNGERRLFRVRGSLVEETIREITNNYEHRRLFRDFSCDFVDRSFTSLIGRHSIELDTENSLEYAFFLSFLWQKP